MNLVSATEVMRKWAKIFSEYDEAIVLQNNKQVWLIIWGKLATKILENWLLQQIKEEMWELQDKETLEIVKAEREWKKTDEISLDDYLEKYGI